MMSPMYFASAFLVYDLRTLEAAVFAGGDKRNVMASRTASQVSYTGTDWFSSPGSGMLRCAGKEDSFWLSAGFVMALGFVDGLCFGMDNGYGAERGAELRRDVLGMVEDYGDGGNGLNHE